MTLKGTAVLNLIIEVMGIMICLFALIIIKYGAQKHLSSKKYMAAAFSSMLAYNMCLLLLELSQAEDIILWRLGVYLIGVGTYLFPLITVYIISKFIVRILRTTLQLHFNLNWILNILMGIETGTIVISQLTGNLLCVDSMGRFSYGALSWVGFSTVFLFMAFDMILLLCYGQNITPRQKKAFIAYLLLPILSAVFRGLCPGVYIVALASCLSMMIMLFVIVSEQSETIHQKEIDNEQLKVDLMLSQIQPHFLFNILYVIQEICLIDAEMASNAIADFSRYLRHNMDSITINKPIPFREELDHVNHYVSLQQLRFGDSLDVRYELECTEFELPTLTLQPLVENAIRYGVRKNRDGKGTVRIQSMEYADHYELHVIDNGPGFIASKISDDGISHLGLKNVSERLKRISGGELIVNSVLEKGTDAAIILPK